MSEVTGCPKFHPFLEGQTRRGAMCTDKKNTDLQNSLGMDTKPFSSMKSCPPLLLGVEERGRSVNVLSTPHSSPPALPSAPGSRDFSTAALLCFWIQPLEDGSVPGHAGNHQILLWKTSAQRSHQCQGPKNTHPKSLQSKSQAGSSQPSALLCIPSKGRCFGGNWDFTGLPGPLGTQVGVF